MIPQIFLGMLYAVIYLLTSPLRLLNDVTIDSGITSAVIQAKSYLSIVDPLVPMSTLLIVFGSMLGIEIIIASYKLIMWVIKKIPFIN